MSRGVSNSKRAKAHAKHAYTCNICGKVVHGNGARWMHREMHRRKGDMVM